MVGTAIPHQANYVIQPTVYLNTDGAVEMRSQGPKPKEYTGWEDPQSVLDQVKKVR